MTLGWRSDGGSASVQVQWLLAADFTVAPTLSTRTGYIFNGWNDGTSGATLRNFATDTMGTAPMSLYAQWTVNSYNVTFDAQGGAPTPSVQSVAFGGLVTAPTAPTLTGYTFNGWYTAASGGTLWNFASDTMGAAPMTLLIAQWGVDPTPLPLTLGRQRRLFSLRQGPVF